MDSVSALDNHFRSEVGRYACDLRIPYRGQSPANSPLRTPVPRDSPSALAQEWHGHGTVPWAPRCDLRAHRSLRSSILVTRMLAVGEGHLWLPQLLYFSAVLPASKEQAGVFESHAPGAPLRNRDLVTTRTTMSGRSSTRGFLSRLKTFTSWAQTMWSFVAAVRAWT